MKADGKQLMLTKLCLSPNEDNRKFDPERSIANNWQKFT